MRLTVAQALIRFLSVQHSERDGVEQRLIAGCFGIFGHGNVAGVGQALLEEADSMPFYHARNEQAMVHTAAAYARQKNRLATLACTSSIGPGATNMVTGAAVATINRLPVLLLPGDVFATRASGTVLQELEDPSSYSVTRQRHAAAGVALLGPRRAPRAARPGADGGDARAHRPGGDRRGHALPAPGRAGRGVRLARGAVRAARLARAAAGARAAGAGGGGGADPRRAAPVHRRRRRHDLRRGDRRARGLRRGHRDPGGGDAGGQGLAALRPSAVPRRDRRDRQHGRQRRGARGRRDPRRRHALERLHDRVAARCSPTTRSSSTSTSRPSTRSSTRRCRSSPTRGWGSRR